MLVFRTGVVGIDDAAVSVVIADAKLFRDDRRDVEDDDGDWKEYVSHESAMSSGTRLSSWTSRFWRRDIDQYY